MSELVQVKIRGTVITNRYGSLSDGDILRTDKEFAKHLVEDCAAAEYVNSKDAIAPGGGAVTKPVKPSKKDAAKAAADKKAAEEAEDAARKGLKGSAVAPDVLKAPNGQEAQLGELVNAAFEASELSAVEWNTLPDDEREQFIADEAARFIANNPEVQ